MSDIAISVSNVSKCYRVFANQRARLLHAVWPPYSSGMEEVWALKDINFEIRRGESVAIIGRNGGGKSTLLEILTGTVTPTAGSVKVNGRVSALLELGSGFNPEYSGRDNVLLNGLLLGVSKNDILSRFPEIEAFAEIGAAIDRPVKAYSSGMLMRLAFAVQVLCDPDILIIDEALSVGDFFFQQKCLGRIRELRNRGATLVFVSHDMRIVRDICGRAIYLDRGTVVGDADSARIVSRYLQQGDDISDSTFDTMDKEEINQDFNADGLLARLTSPIWQRQNTVKKNDSSELIEVGLFDKQDNPISEIKMGEIVKLSVIFRYDGLNKKYGHVSIGIINMYDQLVTCFNKNIEIGAYGFFCKFDFIFPASFESGKYSIVVTLGEKTGPNTGKCIDQTPNIGPLLIYWNYQDCEAPFIGMFGLGVECVREHYQDLC